VTRDRYEALSPLSRMWEARSGTVAMQEVRCTCHNNSVGNDPQVIVRRNARIQGTPGFQPINALTSVFGKPPDPQQGAAGT
jgi:hypothetical protein